MKQSALAEHGSRQRGSEVDSGEKPAVGTNEGVDRRPRAAQHLVGEMAVPAFRRSIVRNDDQEIVVGVSIRVPAGDGTKKIDALGLVGLGESLDDRAKLGVPGPELPGP